MNINTQFNEFYENIKLTKNQKDDAKIKYDGVCKKLHNEYYPKEAYTGQSKLLIGSYGKHTNIRPPRDVDVLFIMPNNLYDKYNEYTSNGQSQLLQDVKNILSEKYSTTDRIKAWGKVILIEFSENVHNIELLPAFKKNDGQFIIPNSEDGGSWETWDPALEIKTIQDSNKKYGITIQVIRMIKKWVEFCLVDIKSYEIEKCVVNFLKFYNFSGSFSDTIKNFFLYLKDQNINGDDKVKTKIESAYDRSQKACNFEEDNHLEEASREWKKIFGNDFPLCLESEALNDEDCNSKPINNPPQPWLSI